MLTSRLMLSWLLLSLACAPAWALTPPAQPVDEWAALRAAVEEDVRRPAPSREPEAAAPVECDETPKVDAVSAEASPVTTVLRFSGERVVPRPEIRAAASLRIDAWAAILPTEPDVTLGVALVLDGETPGVPAWMRRALPAPAGPWRTSLQVGPGLVGFGVARRIIPVVELSVGVAALYRVSEETWVPSIYVSRFVW